MNYSMDSDTLSLCLDGRIDTSNAAQTEKEIFALIGEHEPKSIILDAEKLEYISSVGLRLILKLKKAVGDIKINNASLGVYDIFATTGFTEMVEVHKAMRSISVEGCEIIGTGGHAKVYRIDGDTIVKVYNEGEAFDEIEREISYSKKAFVYGIPTAISYDIVKCGKAFGVVFELINADTLANRLCSEPEKFDEYSRKYNALVKKLHETEADTSVFSNVKELYNKWADDMLKFYTPDEVAVLHEVINSIPDRNTFIHGDIHPKNIMVQDGELLFIDMADITYGHPIFDYLGVALTHVLSKSFTPKVIGIKAKDAVRLYNNMIKANFADSAADIKDINEVIMGYALMKYALAPAVSKSQSKLLEKLLVMLSRRRFFPKAKGLIGSINF